MGIIESLAADDTDWSKMRVEECYKCGELYWFGAKAEKHVCTHNVNSQGKGKS